MRRTWSARIQAGTFFRNTHCVNLDRKRLWNRVLPSRYMALVREWEGIIRVGVTEQRTSLSHGDRFIPWDDSPEATEARVRKLTGERYIPPVKYAGND